MSAVWDRECAFAALTDHLCPRYRMPGWICTALHLLTGTLRSVTIGRFDRFSENQVGCFLVDADLSYYPHLDNWTCVHTPGASGDHYWVTDDASTIDSRLYRLVEHGVAVRGVLP